MVPGIKIVFLLLASLVPASAIINLTPRSSFRDLEGVQIPELLFSDGEKKISYEPPKGWEYYGGGTEITFSSPEHSLSEAKIELGPHSNPLALDEEGINLLKKEALKLIPKDSEKVIFFSEEKNPIMFNESETFEVFHSFVLFAQQYKTSVLFVNLGDQQLRFRVIAKSKDFDQIHQQFLRSLYSWQWL